MDAATKSSPIDGAPAVPGRSAVWCAAIGAFLLVYLFVYPLVPIALQQSGLGKRLPDWIEGSFKVSAAPLLLLHKTVPAYRSYVKLLSNLNGPA